MGDLVLDTPKPMLPILGKPILEYKFDALPDVVDEVILVVGYLGGVIQKHFGGSYNGRRIYYVEQEEPAGTADALWHAKDLLKEKFIAMNGDDLYSKEDTESCLAYEWAMLVQERDPLLSGGKVLLDGDTHSIVDIQEGTHEGGGFINAGLYVLDTRLFDFPLVPKAEGNSEFGLPQTILAASKSSNIPFSAVQSTFWLQITEPADIQKAEEILGNQA
jgi:NDP-sugar pyrophosphorylase family protein